MENFQTVHKKATEMLDAAESEAGESLTALGKTKEEIETEAGELRKKLVGEKVGKIGECIETHFGTWEDMPLDDEVRSIRETLFPLVSDIPKGFEQTIVGEALHNDEWKKAEEENSFVAGRFFSILLSLLFENGSECSLEFSENDFPEPPDSFGAYLKAPMSLVLHGDAGESVGHLMSGGSITVEGNAGRDIGWGMSSGTLDLRGEVLSFRAFSPQNKGTIIWKGVKIWENGGWTPEGRQMRNEGRI